MMGRNPILNTDILGDFFTKRSQKKVDEIKDVTSKRIEANENTIKSLKMMSASLDNNSTTSNTVSNLINGSISSLELSNKEYKGALNEIEKMETSKSQKYILKEYYNYGDGQMGETYYNNRKDAVVMMGSTIGTKAHELKHGYQYYIGFMSFHKKTGQSGLLHDLTDERAAFNRQAAYDNKPQLRNLTDKQLINFGYSLPNISLTKTSTVREVLKYQNRVKVDNLTESQLNSEFYLNSNILEDKVSPTR